MQERESKQDAGEAGAKREDQRGHGERDLDVFPRKREASDFGTHGGSHRGSPRQGGGAQEPKKGG